MKSENEDDGCTRIFELYYRELAYFAYRLLKDKEAGEDVTQDVFVTLFEKGVPFEEHMRLKSYLYTTVKNRCFDYLKHQKVVEEYHRSNQLENEPAHDTVLTSIIEAETMAILKQEIDLLPKECGKVMRYFLLGYNSTEIAEMLEIEPSTVRAQKQRGLQLLKQSLPRRVYLVIFSTWVEKSMPLPYYTRFKCASKTIQIR